MGSSGDIYVAEYAVDGMDALHKVWYKDPSYGHGAILWQDMRHHPRTNGDGATVDYCDGACAVDLTRPIIFVGGSHNSGTYARPMIRMEQALFDADPGPPTPTLVPAPNLQVTQGVWAYPGLILRGGHFDAQFTVT